MSNASPRSSYISGDEELMQKSKSLIFGTALANS